MSSGGTLMVTMATAVFGSPTWMSVLKITPRLAVTRSGRATIALRTSGTTTVTLAVIASARPNGDSSGRATPVAPTAEPAATLASVRATPPAPLAAASEAAATVAACAVGCLAGATVDADDNLLSLAEQLLMPTRRVDRTPAASNRFVALKCFPMHLRRPWFHVGSRLCDFCNNCGHRRRIVKPPSPAGPARQAGNESRRPPVAMWPSR